MNGAWIIAIRPKTLTASAGPVLLGLGFAFQESNKIHIPLALATLLCALLMQIGTNLVNDYYDGVRGTDTPNRLGPTRVTQAGLLSPASVQRAYWLCFSLAFVLGVVLTWIGGPWFFLLGMSCLIMAYAYTGGPIPLSHYGLGEVLALFFFGPVAVAGTSFLQTGLWSKWAIFCGLGPGLIAATLMAINNTRDIESDRIAHKLTVPSLLGNQGARLFIIGLVLASATIPILSAYLLNLKLFAFLPATGCFLLFSKTWKSVLTSERGPIWNQYLARTGQYLFLYGIFFSLALALSS